MSEHQEQEQGQGQKRDAKRDAAVEAVAEAAAAFARELSGHRLSRHQRDLQRRAEYLARGLVRWEERRKAGHP